MTTVYCALSTQRVINISCLQRGDLEQVSWENCQTFIRRLNELTGKKFRLPTEAEWEFAVNAYDKGKGSPDYGTHVVKTKQPNELGIYDMSGNVWEWCSDWEGKYTDAAQTNPKGADSGSPRVNCRAVAVRQPYIVMGQPYIVMGQPCRLPTAPIRAKCDTRIILWLRAGLR